MSDFEQTRTPGFRSNTGHSNVPFTDRNSVCEAQLPFQN
jgi:hypothetical protein